MKAANLFLPLEESPEGFVFKNDVANIIGFDEDEAEDFTAQLENNFTTFRGTVIINGSTFSNCEIFKPNANINDKFYVEVNSDGIPSQFGEISENKPSADWVNDNLLEVRNSEYYYYQYFTHLDNNYITPYIKKSEDLTSPLVDYSYLLNTPRLIITGGPGSGKTTLIRKLAYHLLKKLDKARKPGIVPVYIKLRELNFASNEFALDQFIKETYTKLTSEVASETFAQGRFLLLCDGLDEIEAKYRDLFLVWLNRHILTNERFRIIICSRDISILNEPEFTSFKHVKLAPFNLSQMREYCYKLTTDKTARNFFYHMVEKNTDLEKILSNPLLLSLALRVYLDKNILPSDITSLVKEIVDHLCENWDLNRKIKRYNLLTPSLTKSVLSRISYYLHTHEKFYFHIDEVENFLPHKLASLNIKDVLNEIVETTSLLALEHESAWSFSHIFYQDFFCANYLIDKSSSVKDDFSKFKENPRWINVWNHLIEMSSDPEFYLQDSIGSEYEKSLSLVRMTTLFRKSDYLNSALYSIVLKQLQSHFDNYSEKIEKVYYSEDLIRVNLKDPSMLDISILEHILRIILIKNQEMSSDYINQSLFTNNSEFTQLVNVLLASPNEYYIQKTKDAIEILKAEQAK